MNRSIKVSDEVYNDLLQLQRPRETFSEVVGRLLSLYSLITKAEPIIKGAEAYLRSHQGDDLQAVGQTLDSQQIKPGQTV